MHLPSVRTCFLILIGVISLTSLAADEAQGQNLLVNGGFESGSFSGWTVSGNATIDTAPGNHTEGVRSALFMGIWGEQESVTVSQTFSTTPGNIYRLSFGVKEDNDGENAYYSPFSVVISDVGEVWSSWGTPHPYRTETKLFSAKGSSTTVTFRYVGSGSALLDDVQIVEPRVSRPGKYSGVLSTTYTLPDADVSAVTKTRLSVRIDSSGRIFGIGTTLSAFTGIIQDNGSVSIDNAQPTTAVMKGASIKFETTSSSSVGSTFSTLMTRSFAYSLKRIGN